MKKKTSLVILAAGLGSRYGSLKQLESFGPNGECIIDYSIYDAIQAGFDKIVFVVRSSFRHEMKRVFDTKYGDQVELLYVDQELHDLPDGIPIQESRTKPWGTGHATWVTRDVIDEPFGVINADDFYGRKAFQLLHDFLVNDESENYCVISYKLGNTLSEFGGVNRGVCSVDHSGNLLAIKEKINIMKIGHGVITSQGQDDIKVLDKDSCVSMNMFGLKPSYFEYSESYLRYFVPANRYDQKAEFYIPLLIDKLISKGVLQVKSITTLSKWFGVTYREDRRYVSEKLRRLHTNSEYPKKQWWNIEYANLEAPVTIKA